MLLKNYKNKKSGNSNTSEEDNDENSYDSRNSSEKKIDNNKNIAEIIFVDIFPLHFIFPS